MSGSFTRHLFTSFALGDVLFNNVRDFIFISVALRLNLIGRFINGFNLSSPSVAALLLVMFERNFGIDC